MDYIWHYDSPLGGMTMASDGQALIGLWFDGQKHFGEVLDSGYYKQDETVITLADTKEGLKESSAYTLQANEKGYIVTIKINNDYKVFAKYQYIEQS